MDGRELTLGTVLHPEFIDGGQWQRVDHPVLDPIQSGNAEVGFEGDPRLVVYLNLEHQTFVLWRLEHDGEYRPVASISGSINEENVNRLCARLVEIDTRRGFDAGAEVIAAQDAYYADSDARLIEMSNDFAAKLRFALSRSHLPGVDVSKGTFAGFGG